MIATKEQILETLNILKSQRFERSMKNLSHDYDDPASESVKDIMAILTYETFIKEYSNG